MKNVNLPIVIDDFVDLQTKNKIEDIMFDCPWILRIDHTIKFFEKDKYRKFYSPIEYDVCPAIISNVEFVPQLNSLWKSLIKSVCKKISFNLKKIDRSLAGIQGIQLLDKNSKIGYPHINQKTPHLVFLYYVNDSDGNTILYDDRKNIKKEISPKRGRILLFDGKTYHSSSSPTKNVRCIITSDLIGNFEDKDCNLTNIKYY